MLRLSASLGVLLVCAGIGTTPRCWAAAAWTMPMALAVRRRRQREGGGGIIAASTTTTQLQQQAAGNIFFQGPEEEECPSEDECEIDWDKMPGGGSSEDAATDSTQPDPSSSSSNNSNNNSSNNNSGGPSIETARLRLEMMWGMTEAVEDCVVDQPDTCGSLPCTTCRGKGQRICRFCHGATKLLFERQKEGGGGVAAAASATAQNCPVCVSGHEVCATCRGTGWVAEWTQLKTVH